MTAVSQPSSYYLHPLLGPEYYSESDAPSKLEMRPVFLKALFYLLFLLDLFILAWWMTKKNIEFQSLPLSFGILFYVSLCAVMVLPKAIGKRWVKVSKRVIFFSLCSIAFCFGIATGCFDSPFGHNIVLLFAGPLVSGIAVFISELMNQENKRTLVARTWMNILASYVALALFDTCMNFVHPEWPTWYRMGIGTNVLWSVVPNLLVPIVMSIDLDVFEQKVYRKVHTNQRDTLEFGLALLPLWSLVGMLFFLRLPKQLLSFRSAAP